MDIVGIFDRIKTWREGQRTSQIHAARAFLERAIAVADGLVQADPADTDQAQLLHEEARRLYQDASQFLGRGFDSEMLEQVLAGLSGVRIYYWLRCFEGKPSEELRVALADFLKTDRHVPGSFDYVVRQLLHRESSEELYTREFVKVRDFALRNVSAIRQAAVRLERQPGA